MAKVNPTRSLASRFDPAWLMPVLSRLPFKFNPLTPEARRDPHRQYRALREKSPVYYSPLLRGWVLTRYDDVASVLRDPRFSSDRRNSPTMSLQSARMAKELPELHRFSEGVISGKDAPEHTRLRKLVNKAFTPSVVKRLEPRIEEVVGQCIDDALEKRSMEVISELAFPLPVTVIAEMLGVDAGDADEFGRWATDLFSLTDPMSMFRADLREAAEKSVGDMRRYLKGMADDRRRLPQDDLLTALVGAEDEGKRLSEDELLSMCGALVLAGHETTTNLIGMATHCLLRFPEERDRLRQSPQLLPSAIEEVLRFEGVSHLIMRIAIEDTEVGSGKSRVVVRKGQMVLLALAAANRDPEQFPEPDRFDVARSPNRHLGFGHGVHFCLGANLARGEAQIAIRCLLDRLPDFSGVTVEAEWKSNPMLRGLKRLQLDWNG